MRLAFHIAMEMHSYFDAIAHNPLKLRTLKKKTKNSNVEMVDQEP